ncbi:MAG TPA: hypothetical protein VGT78_06575 [Rhizomicrobium sp.]|nr:hypothetical protein [Rhizomicrobium sp.]
MSELIRKHDNRATIRWKLLTGVSAFALAAYISSGSIARAEEASQPQIWIELGGQLSRLSDAQESFFPSRMAAVRPSIFAPSDKFERPPLYSFDETGKISFEPSASDWVFSASIRIGRSSNKGDARQNTNPKPFVKYLTSAGQSHRYARYPVAQRFADTATQISEKHLILDFQVGKDVGLGLFGAYGSSVLNFGVRFAQFSSKSNIALKSDPDWQFNYKYAYGFKIESQGFHTNRAMLQAERGFHGVGPMLSWNGSAPLAGNTQNGELSFDGGVNAAMLFGRQRTKIHHQISGQSRPPVFESKYGPRYVTYQPPAVNHTRVRSVTVPNVGGFAGLTYRIEDFKISFGYRADFFFGAMDGGIDAAKKENVGFNGPYASISVGLGD